MGCDFFQVSLLLALLITTPGCFGDFYPTTGEYEEFKIDSQEEPLNISPMQLIIQDRGYSEEESDGQSGEVNTEFASRQGIPDSPLSGGSQENARGIFAYKTKSKRIFKTVSHDHGPPSFHPVPRPPPFIHGHNQRPHHHSHHHPPHHHHHRPKVPHYVKYWKQNQAHHHHQHRPKQGWKMVSHNPLSRGYFIDLAERIADGIGYLPEYGKHEHHEHGSHNHGKHKYKGITLHNGFFTEVI